MKSATDWTTGWSTFELHYGVPTLVNGALTAWQDSQYQAPLVVEINLTQALWRAGGNNGILAPQDKSTLATAMQTVQGALAPLGAWVIANLPSANGASVVNGV